MASVHHLLRAEEAALVACLRDVQRFSDSFEQSCLDSAERTLMQTCGSSARAIVSQGLFLMRILAEDGVMQRRPAAAHAARASRRADALDMRLLALIEAAQSSRSRLESLLSLETRPTPELVFVLIRFAALLLAAGLRLPRRENGSAPLDDRESRTVAPPLLQLQVT